MEKIKNLVLILALVILSGYAIMVLALYVFQDYFIFFPQRLSENSTEVLKNKEYELSIDIDGIVLHGWLLDKGGDKLIIYYGGNAEEVSANISDMKNIAGYSVLLMNYRGYGLNKGRPGEKALFSDALIIYDHIISKLGISGENIILMGRSLGSGVAVYVAGKRRVAKLILVTPFDSIRNLAQKQFPIMPVSLILRHSFDSVRYAQSVTAEALMLIGNRDNIIPNGNSLNLAKNWNGECETIIIKEAGHNDIHTYSEYWVAISEFLNK
jgi:pimeloyl-ACP methyl ester carboxylesterase